MKVFRRAGTPDRSTNTAYEVPKLQTHVSSCQAIKNAVSTLYNMGDFEMTKIGEGFFSEVFKVSKIFRQINFYNFRHCTLHFSRIRTSSSKFVIYVHSHNSFALSLDSSTEM